MAEKISLREAEWVARMNLAHVADMRGDWPDALHHAETACKLKPAAESLFGLGIILAHAGRWEDARAIYNEAIRLNPKPIYRYNLAFVELMLENYQEGFDLYETRLFVQDDRYYETKTNPMKSSFLQRFPAAWDGHSPYRKLFVYQEQGLGDTLFFMRWLTFLKGDVTLEIQRNIAPVVQAYVPNVKVIPRDGDYFPPYDNKKYDACVSLCSLGKWFWNREVKVPYLPCPVKERQGNLRVGLCWAGYPGFPGDQQRSMKLSEFKRLPLEGVDYYSFQMGTMVRKHEEVEVNYYDHHFPFTGDATHQIYDWRDTMRLVGEMDLVITVDTSLAHLCGAMGKACWLLVPFSPDWRWCPDLNGISRWYPSVRVFHQAKFGDWSTAVEKVATELKSLI